MNKTLTAAILLMASSYTGAAARTITASQFGAIPNDGKDDAPALRKAAEYCRNNPGTTFVLEPGVYDFFDPTAERIEREAISGAYGRGDLDVQYRLFKPKGPYVKALDFTGSKNLTIEGSGATLKMHGWYEVITLTQVKNTEIKGLSITYNRPPATQGTVVASGPEYFDVRLDPSCTYLDSIVTGRMHMYSAKGQNLYYGWFGNKFLVDKNTVRIMSNVNPPAGDIMVLRHGGHYRAAIFIKESKDVNIKGVKILCHPGMGIVGHLSENILIDGLQVVPEPGKYSSTNTDATHFTSCSGTLTIKNCSFRGNGDDCTNIHNYYYYIYPQGEKTAEIRIENADLHAQSLDYPQRGDTMVVMNRENMQEAGKWIVAKVDTSWADWKVVVTFTKPLNLDDPNKYYMTNISRTPRVSITDNTANAHLARGFLIKTPNAYIARNTMTNCMRTAIKLGGEISWREAGPVHDVIIEDNYIYNCCTDDRNDASCVLTSTEATQTPEPPNRNIIIRNNIFFTQNPIAIKLQDARDVKIENNLVNKPDYVQQINCKNVTIK